MTDPEDAGYDDIPLEIKEAAKAAMGQLEAVTRRIGLHVKEQDLVLVAQHDGEPRMGVAATFMIGDLAWSDRVQHPEIDADAGEIASMETHLMRDKVQELRDRVRRKKDEDDEVSE